MTVAEEGRDPRTGFDPAAGKRPGDDRRLLVDLRVAVLLAADVEERSVGDRTHRVLEGFGNGAAVQGVHRRPIRRRAVS